MKKADLNRNIRLGVFTVVALGVMGLALLTLGRKSGLFIDYYRLNAEFATVQGLKEGQPVWLNGLDVGLVESIRLSEDKAGKIRAALIVDKAYQPWIREDSVAVLETKGLLGDKIVNIMMSTGEGRVLEDGDFIEAAEPMAMEKLVDEVGQVLGGIKGSLDAVREVIDGIAAGEGTLGKLASDTGVYDESERVLKNLNETIVKINRGQGTIGRLVGDDQLYRQIEQITARVDRILGETEGIVGTIAGGDGNVGKLVYRDDLYANLESATTSLKNLASRMEQGEGSVGKMVAADQMHDRLVELIESLNVLATDIKENPGRYFKVSVFGGRK